MSNFSKVKIIEDSDPSPSFNPKLMLLRDYFQLPG